MTTSVCYGCDYRSSFAKENIRDLAVIINLNCSVPNELI